MYRYIGNKTKLSQTIVDEIKKDIPEKSTIVDLMAGTGAMSVEFRKNGFKVIANDVMTYSKHHLTVQLLLNGPMSFSLLSEEIGGEKYEDVLGYLNSLNPVKGYFYNEFSPEGTPANGSPSRKYFTSSNASKIDAIREKINRWIYEKKINPKQESLLKHTLIMAVNEVANISGTYGYFLSSFSKSASQPIILSPVPFLKDGSIDNVVLQDFAENISPALKADACYIDPPYMKRQYAANYHILETIARGDYPVAVGMSGLRDWWDQYSCFCTKTKIFDSFGKIMQMNCPYFYISYSEDGLIPIDTLKVFFEKYGEVTIKEIKYKRFRSNNSPLGKEILEYLIKVRRRNDEVR